MSGRLNEAQSNLGTIGLCSSSIIVGASGTGFVTSLQPQLCRGGLFSCSLGCQRRNCSHDALYEGHASSEGTIETLTRKISWPDAIRKQSGDWQSRLNEGQAIKTPILPKE
jgi:hypothetical protein